MTCLPLAPFFDPHAVAVIGASHDPSKVGGSVLANLRSAGFLGRVIPINTQGNRPGARRPPIVARREGTVDLAVITVPAEASASGVEGLREQGVRGAVVISAGFRESADDEGKRRETELREWLRGQPICVLGPTVWDGFAPPVGSTDLRARHA